MACEPNDPAEASRASPLPAGTYCPDCGYDLRGLTSDRCPECGFDLEPVRTQTPQIPWAHRRELGFRRAYCRTVWLVARHPRRFCLEIVRPVSERDAAAFRRTTLCLAYLPVLLGSVLWCGFDRTLGWTKGSQSWWWLVCVQLVALFLFSAIPDVASVLFGVRGLSDEQRRRAMYLSYYASGPFVLTNLALPFLTLALVSGAAANRNDMAFVLAGVGGCGAAGVLLSVALLYQTNLNVLAKFLLRLSLPRRLWRGLVLFAAGLVLALVALSIPLGLFYVLVIVDSLR